MPEQTSPAPDFLTAQTWHGLRPGMSRAGAQRVIEAAEFETRSVEDDPGWLLIVTDEWELALRFDEGGEQRLRSLTLDDFETRWGGREIVGLRFHEALEVLGDEARDAGWRPEGRGDPFETSAPEANAAPVSDSALLGDGTLWLPRRGLGLIMCEGEVNEVEWRLPEDVPKQFVGPVTEAQKQISMRPDMQQFLRKRWAAERAAAAEVNPLQRVLTLVLAIILGTIGWRAFQETQRWQQAQVLTGKLAGIDKATRRPWVDHYLIKYTDPTGRAQLASLERGEFYVAPREIGDETQIHYLAGDPPRTKGPARARDSAFIDYAPKALGAGAIYIVLWTAAGFAWRLMRLSKSTAAAPASPAAPSPFTPDRGR